MELIGITDEDFVNYCKPALYLAFPYCTFKCGKNNCQNKELEDANKIDVPTEAIVERYLQNPITSAIICAGLEPFMSWEELKDFIYQVRLKTNDDIVIYTGYEEEENPDIIKFLADFPNIIVKFGRYIPNQEPHLDPILGVKLASPNQYAKRIGK